MELRHLRYFLAVAETGNVTRAARRCYVAQSALSTQLTRLEGELGVQLLRRSTRGVTLTPAGEALRPMASRLVADASAIEEHMTALQNVVTGRLRLGAIQGTPAHLGVVTLVADYHRDFPGVELTVRTGASSDLLHAVRDGDLDVAIIALPRETIIGTGVEVTPLYDDPLVAVLAAHDLPDSAPMTLVQLLAHGPLIHYRRGSGLRHSVDAALARAGIADPETPFELDQIADMIRLATLGLGVAVVPASAVDAPLGSGARVVPLADEQALHTIAAISLAAPSPASAAFLRQVATQ